MREDKCLRPPPWAQRGSPHRRGPALGQNLLEGQLAACLKSPHRPFDPVVLLMGDCPADTARSSAGEPRARVLGSSGTCLRGGQSREGTWVLGTMWQLGAIPEDLQPGMMVMQLW